MRKILSSLACLALCLFVWAGTAGAAAPRVLVLPFAVNAPEATAQDMGEYLTQKCPDLISKFNVVKGFLNLSIASAQWIQLLQEIEHNPKFGFLPVTDESPLVMIEYSSPASAN